MKSFQRRVLLLVVAATAAMSIGDGPAAVAASATAAATSAGAEGRAAGLKTSSTAASASATVTAALRASRAAAAEVHDSHAHRNMRAQQQQQRRAYYAHRYDSDHRKEDGAVGVKSTLGYAPHGSSGGGGDGAAYNGLANLWGSRHISGGSGSGDDGDGGGNDGSSYYGAAVAKQEIPIYEEQEESVDYAGAASPVVPAAHTPSAGARSQPPREPALATAIYNLHAAGAHNSFQPTAAAAAALRDAVKSPTPTSTTAAVSSTASSSYWPTSSSAAASSTQHEPQQLWQAWQASSWQSPSPSPSPSQSPSSATYDKRSDGNFLQHYEHNFGHDELPAGVAAPRQKQQQHEQHVWQQQQQQQWQQHVWQPQQQQSLQYFTPHDSSASSSFPSAESSSVYEQDPIDAHTGANDHDDADAGGPDFHQHDVSSNYLDASHGSYATGGGGHSAQPDVINYIPYPVVKKQHVPVRANIRIPISHAVIVPIGKPVPIHIPVAQQVQVPVEKELKIPIERVVPYPVERHVPVPVEKRVPYPVVKYVPVKVARPYPVKVPVYKTILHKVKGWW